MSDRYSVRATESGLLVAGPSVGFAKGELVTLSLDDAPAPADPDCVAGQTLPVPDYWPSNIQVGE